jgi:hypothetical protein
MTRKDKYRKHQRRRHEQTQHKARVLKRDVKRNLAEAKITLKRRKKKIDTYIDTEMAKRGFERIGPDDWRRMVNA